ncbi:floral homeotic protein agamous [Quercus suber]|uniref:Floral homeotic protein agamous n=1 Tax=Quercus suber TaxID=58331 RepID=A0AAW0J6V0_QUESU
MSYSFFKNSRTKSTIERYKNACLDSSETSSIAETNTQNSRTKSTIERYKNACLDSSETSSIAETNTQYYQQESAKLRLLIQNMQDSNRDQEQLENKIVQGLIKIKSKKVNCSTAIMQNSCANNIFLLSLIGRSHNESLNCVRLASRFL